MRIPDTTHPRCFRFMTAVSVTALVMSLTLVTTADAQNANGRADPATFQYRDLTKELANTMTGTYVVAAAGDLLIQEPFGKQISPEIQAVLRGATTTVGNMEATMIDTRNWRYGRTGNYSPLATARDIADLGFDLLTGANNHAGESGVEGLMSVTEALARVGIPLAGVGPNLSTAREAVIQHTAQGRVAMVGAYSIDGGSERGARDKQGNLGMERWGRNEMVVTSWNVVTPAQLQQLKAIRDSILVRRTQPDVVRPIPIPQDEPNRVQIFADRYMAGPRAGDYVYEVNPGDREAQILSVRNAAEYADFAIFTMHVHQNRYAFQASSNDNYPNQFLIDLLHEMVDNGMSMYVGTGNHTMQGIEIYKGRPIFYNLGNFSIHELLLEENDPPPGLTSIEAQELSNDGLQQPENLMAMVAQSTYEEGKLREVRIYPVDLGVGKNRVWPQMSIARTPSPELARDILTKIQEYSKPFGTQISIENGVGVIRVPPEATVPVGGDLRLNRGGGRAR